MHLYFLLKKNSPVCWRQQGCAYPVGRCGDGCDGRVETYGPPWNLQAYFQGGVQREQDETALFGCAGWGIGEGQSSFLRRRQKTSVRCHWEARGKLRWSSHTWLDVRLTEEMLKLPKLVFGKLSQGKRWNSKNNFALLLICVVVCSVFIYSFFLTVSRASI